MGPQIISLKGGIPFLPGPLERSSIVALQKKLISNCEYSGTSLQGTRQEGNSASKGNYLRSHQLFF